MSVTVSSSPEQPLSLRPAGCDVSAEALDIKFPGSAKPVRFTNDPRGRNAVVKRLRTERVDLLVLESTGGLERPIATLAHGENVPVAIVNPRQVRDFARGIGKLCKNDATDAAVLAEFGAKVPCRRWAPKPANQQEITDLSDRITSLARMRAAEVNRSRCAVSDAVIEDINANIAHINARIRVLEKRIEQLIAEDEGLARKAQILRSMKSVGAKTVSVIIAHMPELGIESNCRCSALAGVAPYDDDSGKTRGKRRIMGGRKEVRNQLYLCSMSAVRWVPKIKSYYQSLCSRMPKKAALVAVMRKILWTLAGMLRKNQAWDPNFNLAA